jgi:hypothetical protein
MATMKAGPRKKYNRDDYQETGEPDEDYFEKLADGDEDKPLTKQQTISSLQARTNQELIALEGQIADLRGRLFAEGEAKAEGKESGCSSVETQAWQALRKAEYLNKTMKSVLARL